MPTDHRREEIIKGILLCLTHHPAGLTGAELAAMLKTKTEYIAPRLTELKKASKVRVIDVRPTKGRKASVFALA